MPSGLGPHSGKRLFGEEQWVYHKRRKKHIVRSYHRYRVVCGKRTGGRGGSYMSKFDRKVDVVVFLAGDLVAALLKGGHVGRAGWHASGQAGRERGVP